MGAISLYRGAECALLPCADMDSDLLKCVQLVFAFLLISSIYVLIQADETVVSLRVALIFSLLVHTSTGS